MRIELKIPDGWVRVRKGKVQRGDMLSVIFHGVNATVGAWHSTDRKGERGWEKAIGAPVRNFHCVIRRKGGA